MLIQHNIPQHASTTPPTMPIYEYLLYRITVVIGLLVMSGMLCYS